MKQIFKELQTMYAGTKGIEEYVTSLEKALHHNKDIIGIGAGRTCDGQVLVLQDMIGISSLAPKFSLNFLTDGRNIPEAIKAYVDAVRNTSFPTDDQCFF